MAKYPLPGSVYDEKVSVIWMRHVFTVVSMFFWWAQKQLEVAFDYGDWEA